MKVLVFCLVILINIFEITLCIIYLPFDTECSKAVVRLLMDYANMIMEML